MSITNRFEVFEDLDEDPGVIKEEYHNLKISDKRSSKKQRCDHTLKFFNGFQVLERLDEDPEAISEEYFDMITCERINKKQRFNLLNLQRDTLFIVLNKFGPIIVLNKLQNLCQSLRLISKDKELFQILDFRDSDPNGTYKSSGIDVVKIAGEAIKRWSEFITELYLDEDVGQDRIFICRTNYFNCLEKLGLCCVSLSEEVLADILKAAPNLTDLHLCHCNISKEVTQVLSNHCSLVTNIEIFCKEDLRAFFFFFEDKNGKVHNVVQWITSNLPNIRFLGIKGVNLCRLDIDMIKSGLRNLLQLDFGDGMLIHLKEYDVMEVVGKFADAATYDNTNKPVLHSQVVKN